MSLLLLLLLLQFITPSSQSSIRNLLEARGLPGGLFPDNVESYSLDEKTGELEVQLQNPCFTRFENRVYFDSVIRANLSYGGLVGLEGLTQEELFLWLPVKGIAVNDPYSGLVLFDIGVAHKQISRSLFEDPPICYPPGIYNGEDREEEDGYSASEMNVLGCVRYKTRFEPLFLKLEQKMCLFFGVVCEN